MTKLLYFTVNFVNPLQYVWSMKLSKMINLQNEDYRISQHPREVDSKNNLYVFVSLKYERQLIVNILILRDFIVFLSLCVVLESTNGRLIMTSLGKYLSFIFTVIQTLHLELKLRNSNLNTFRQCKHVDYFEWKFTRS